MINRRKKNTRAKRYKTHFHGESGKQNRGAGNRGGRGRAGHRKRAAHNKIMYYGEPKKKGFVSRFGKFTSMNVSQLDALGKDSVDLTELGYVKLLGSGKVSKPIKVTKKLSNLSVFQGLKRTQKELNLQIFLLL